jgi:hypothetical protein
MGDNNEDDASKQTTETETNSSATNIFLPIAQETSIIDGRVIDFPRLHPTSTGPFVFNIGPQGQTYLQLGSARLFIQAKLIDGEGKNLEAGNNGKVSLTNLPGCAMFSSIDIMLDGNPLPDLSNKYANYKGYLETVLSYSSDIAKGHLAASHFFMDTAAQFDTFTDANEGHKQRATIVNESTVFQICSPLPSDFFQVDRLFPPGVKITVTLNKADEKFFVCSSDGTAYQLQILDMYLSVRHVTVHPDIAAQHRIDIVRNPIILPYNKTSIQTYAFGPGFSVIQVPYLQQSTIPKTLVIGFLKSKNFHGTFKSNPFNFENMNIVNLSISKNGQTIPSKPYAPNFEQNLFTREYRGFFDNIGITTGNTTNMMTPALFKSGLCLFPFDLTPDQCGGMHCHPQETGTITLDVTFGTALTEPINVIVMSVYDAQIFVDRHNKVYSSIIKAQEKRVLL